jgi:hypothetical protein
MTEFSNCRNDTPREPGEDDVSRDGDTVTVEISADVAVHGIMTMTGSRKL